MSEGPIHMSRFCSLFSSSKGNCTYLSGGATAVLIDAGVSFRAMMNALRLQGLSCDDLRAVLITHEHTDHIKGLRLLVERLGLPVYGSAGTLELLASNGHVPPGATLIECVGVQQVGELLVTAFDIPHDACAPVGYRFAMPDSRGVAIATDLGQITDEVRDHLTGCDLVMLESNYDKGMLECSRYPYYLKRRIKSSHGHLCNDVCAKEAARLVACGTTRLVLAHLSQKNNMPRIAYETGRASLSAAEMKEDYDYILKVAPAQGPQEVLVF